MHDLNKLLEIGIKKRNGEITLSWNEIAEQYGNGYFKSGEHLRCWIKNRIKSNNFSSLDGKSKQIFCLSDNKSELTFKESIDINKDGTQTSNKLVKMSLEDTKNPEFLLKAHGYDPTQWDLISAHSNIWNTYSKKDGIKQLYASKISVKPKSNGFSMEELLKAVRETIPDSEIEVNYQEVKDKRLLEIPFFDSHFGVSDFSYYKQTLKDTLRIIDSRHWEEILFIVGQDLLHNDNFRGQTANGTQIQHLHIPDMWRDAKKFYYVLTKRALKNSNKVKVVYSKGNHDESMSWAFVQMLKERFPKIELDDSFEERKIHTFGKVFIGITHGDKARKNLHTLFPVEFPIEWAQAAVREIHIGHFHAEDAKDVFGMMIRTLSTRNKTDQWHKDNGFVGAHKRFMLFEYSETELKSIHYV